MVSSSGRRHGYILLRWSLVLLAVWRPHGVYGAAQHRKLQTVSDASTVIPQQYVVVLQDSISNVRAHIQRLFPFWTNTTLLADNILFVYEDALKGFAIKGLKQVLLYRLLLNDAVNYIVPDTIVQLTSSGTDQLNPPSWGLDRIDQTSLPLNKNYHYDYTGAGVQAYIIDTGIKVTHTEFLDPTTRVSWASCGANYISGESCDDGNGHGTHVAGTVGGLTYGLAKQVTLFAVKVLDKSGSGATSGVTAGVNFVTARKNANKNQAMVANLSLGGSVNSALNQAVSNAVEAGVVVAVAGGNSQADACQYSPASATSALTVAATDINDNRASYSNFGRCIDLFAPGTNIISCGISSNTAVATKSGTSMATPHVAGVAALLFQQQQSADGALIANMMLSQTVADKVKSAGSNSPNKFLQIPEKKGPTTAPSAKPSPRPSHSRQPVKHPSSRPSRTPVAKPKTPCPTTAACSIKAMGGGTTAGYWVHGKNNKGQCTSTCVATSQVPSYLSKGYLCGKC